MSIEHLKQQAKHNWKTILQHAGVDETVLNGKHQACPFCGGKDRFRFDDKNGDGTYICGQCGAGDGFKFLSNHLHEGFKEIAIMVEDVLGIPNTLPAQTKAIKLNTSAQAVAAFAELPLATTHAYLTRKHIKAVSDIRLNGTELLIPVQTDLNGTLVSVQRILATPYQGKDKYFIKGTDKKGNFCLIGDFEPLPKQVLLTEGYATAATLWQAIGCPVVVCFDAGNIALVIAKLRDELPNTRFIIAADNDEKGIKCAKSAAKRFQCEWVAPNFMQLEVSEKDNDFNDLARLIDLETVRYQLEQVINHPMPVNHEDQPLFRITGNHLEYLAKSTKDAPAEYRILSSAIEVAAVTHNQQGLNHGRLLRFKNRFGQPRELNILMSNLAGDANKLIIPLLDMGLYIAEPQWSNTSKRLAQYINYAQPQQTLINVDRTGWHQNAFVLPHGEVLGKADKLLFSGTHSNIYSKSGSLEDWQTQLAALTAGNSRLTFATSLAFTGILMPMTGDDGAGVNFFGLTSTGKSTTQIVAASVWGNPSAGQFISKWNATATGLEMQAVQRNHTLFCIDELGEVDLRAAGNAIYQLASGTQKGRGRASDQGVGLAESSTWLTPFISSAEKTLQQHVESAGNRLYGGQIVRCVDIPADAGADLGVFEELHGLLEQHEGNKQAAGAAFADRLKARSLRYHGTASRAFINALVQMERKELLTFIKQQREAFNAHLPADAGNIVRRAAKLFSLAAAAGELAIHLDIIPCWPKGSAIQAAVTCFKAWIDHTGGDNPEEQMALNQVRYFIESNWENFRCFGDNTHDDRNIPRQVGFMNADRTVFYVLPEVFKHDVCKEFSPKFMLDVLKKRDWLVCSSGRLQYQIQPEGSRIRVYAIKYEN